MALLLTHKVVGEFVIFHKPGCKPAETKDKDGMYQIDKLYPGINHGGYVFEAPEGQAMLERGVKGLHMYTKMHEAGLSPEEMVLFCLGILGVCALLYALVKVGTHWADKRRVSLAGCGLALLGVLLACCFWLLPAAKERRQARQQSPREQWEKSWREQWQKDRDRRLREATRDWWRREQERREPDERDW